MALEKYTQVAVIRSWPFGTTIPNQIDQRSRSERLVCMMIVHAWLIGTPSHLAMVETIKGDLLTQNKENTPKTDV